MRIIAAVLIWIGAAIGVAAQDRPHDPTIDATIQAQMEAFLADDLGAAYAIASPLIQRMFGSPENFGKMVAEGYPMVRNPASVEYLDQRAHEGSVMQLVAVTDAVGAAHWFAYEMIRVAGAWRINGVFPVEAPQPNV